jgi:hypothetical protein
VQYSFDILETAFYRCDVLLVQSREKLGEKRYCQGKVGPSTGNSLHDQSDHRFVCLYVFELMLRIRLDESGTLINW